jgi:hypothetical protein
MLSNEIRTGRLESSMMDGDNENESEKWKLKMTSKRMMLLLASCWDLYIEKRIAMKMDRNPEMIKVSIA